MRAQFERVSSTGGRFLLAKRRADPSFDFTWHFHREYELTLILDSRGQRYVGDHLEPYEPGDLVLLGPSLPHTWSSNRQARGRTHEAVVVQFSTDPIGPHRLEAPELAHVRALLADCRRGLAISGKVRDAVAPRLEAMVSMPPLRQFATFLEVLEELSQSRGHRTLATRIFAPDFAVDSEHPIDRACRYIDRHFVHDLNLTRVAREVAMSPSAFSRFFKATTKQTFVAHVAALRIGRACQLLIDTDWPVSRIAAAAGFSNLSNFNRRFLLRMRRTPRQYRKAHRP